jgi:hypothetical protein
MRGLVAIEGAGNDKNSFVMQGFQEQGRGKDNPVRLEEIGTAMISLEECCWEMQLQQQQQNQKGGAPLQQLVVVPIRVRKDGWASDAILYVSKNISSSSLLTHTSSQTVGQLHLQWDYLWKSDPRYNRTLLQLTNLAYRL